MGCSKKQKQREKIRALFHERAVLIFGSITLLPLLLVCNSQGNSLSDLCVLFSWKDRTTEELNSGHDYKLRAMNFFTTRRTRSFMFFPCLQREDAKILRFIHYRDFIGICCSGLSSRVDMVISSLLKALLTYLKHFQFRFHFLKICVLCTKR